MARFLYLWTIVFAMVVTAHAGEQSISGIVNAYTKVMSIDATDCHQFVSVASATGLSPGDLVLIVQMKGAGIVTDTTEDFGTITDMNGSGLYEFSRIVAVSGNMVELRHTLFNPYDVNEAVQLVRVPHYDDAVVSAPLRARPWDGATGGVIALDVAGTLRLASDIDASAAGFASGPMWSTGGVCSATFIVLPFYSPYGGAKGEGIARTPSGMEAGRGHIANGGGGGVSHNSGGGGGGNGGSGGMGGKQYLNCFDEDLISGGLGGQAIDHFAGIRMIFGGAGGNGHQNDEHGAAGGAGGGIIVIRATRFDGAGRIVASNGGNGWAGGTNDGGGGGGAGGSIHLQVQEWLSPARIVANGGRGSDLVHPSPHGPGGGGGGGLIVLSTERPAGMTIDLQGGANGHNRIFSRDSPHYDFGAASGTEGIVIIGEDISEHTLGNTFTTNLPKDTTVCMGSVASFTGRPRKGRSPYSTIWRSLPSGDIVSDSATLSVTARTTERFVYTATDANGCDIVDTVTLFVDSSSFIIPDTVNIGTFAACANELKEAAFDIVSEGAATRRGTILSVETTGGISTTAAAGDTFDGRLTVRVFIDTQSDGPVRGTVRLRIDPCGIDRIVHIVGERRSLSLDGDDDIQFTTGFVGQREVRQVRYRNDGATTVHIDRIEAPRAPFAVVSTSPSVPCDLAPDDTLVVFIGGTYQVDASADSCRIVVTTPCPLTLTTTLFMKADGRMTVRIPHLTGRIGQMIDVPILLDVPLDADPVRPLPFTATVRWPARVLRPSGTAFDDDTWTSRLEQGALVTDIAGVWNGGDTLAIIPSLILLNPYDTTPLDLDDGSPFAWLDIPANVEQRDGSLTIIDEVCASQYRYGTTFGGVVESIVTYPMPLRDEFHVTVRTSVSEPISLILIDITGRTVGTAAGSSGTPIRVDASGLAAGPYVLHVMTRFERHDVQIMKHP